MVLSIVANCLLKQSEIRTTAQNRLLKPLSFTSLRAARQAAALHVYYVHGTSRISVNETPPTILQRLKKIRGFSTTETIKPSIDYVSGVGSIPILKLLFVIILIFLVTFLFIICGISGYSWD
jgi:hypothetical protein